MDNSYYEENPNARPSGANTTPNNPTAPGNRKKRKYPHPLIFIFIAIPIVFFIVLGFFFVSSLDIFKNFDKKTTGFIDQATKNDDEESAKEPVKTNEAASRLMRIYRTAGDNGKITRAHCRDYEKSLGVKDAVSICEGDMIYVLGNESTLGGGRDVATIRVGDGKNCYVASFSNDYTRTDSASQNTSSLCGTTKIEIVEDESLETKYAD